MIFKNKPFLPLILISFVTHVSAADVFDKEYGNILNPPANDITRKYDQQGLSFYKKTPSRTPTGFLYQSPFLPQMEKKLDDSWFYRGSIEFGYLTNDGDENAAEFNDYADWSTGALLNYIDLSSWDRKNGRHFEFQGGGVGRDDQYYQIQLGRYGKYKIKGLFNQTPHRYSRNAVTLFNGAGSENLTLPSGLEPGNNNLEQIQQALQSAYSPDLGLDRKQAGSGFQYTPLSGLTLFGDYTYQQRKGSRPFGGSFFPPFYTGGNAGGVVETIEPIDYTSNELAAGLNYTDSQYQFKLKYQGSFFVNNINQLTFENPFINLPGTDFIVERGRIDLYPDNQFHQILADFAYRLPLQGQLTSTFAWSRMQQDDTLIPATVNSGLNFTGINLDLWNQLDSLNRESAEAEIDNLLLQLGVQIMPLKFLTLRSKFRYQDEDNNTRYTAYNSLTHQYGYIAEDGAAGGAVFQPDVASRPIHYRSIPFAKQNLRWDIDTDFRVSTKTKLGIGYRFEQIQYHHREREQTDENRFRFYLSSRSLSWLTLRLSYEFGDRRGDHYNYNPYEQFYSTSIPGFQPILPSGPTPHTLANLRKFDLSSRQQQQLSVRANFLVGDSMDFVLTGSWLKNQYDADFGLQSEQTGTVNVEWNFQPSPALNSYAFYNFQNKRSDMANINDSGFSTDPYAGGAQFPWSSVWMQTTEDTNHFIGFGLRYIFGRFDLDTRYSYTWSNGQIDYRAASDSAFASFEKQALASNFPDLQFDRHILETSLRWHIVKDWSLRFYHRYEKSTTQDWHFQNLSPLIDHHLFLNATPQNYAVHLFGVFIQYRLQ